MVNGLSYKLPKKYMQHLNYVFQHCINPLIITLVILSKYPKVTSLHLINTVIRSNY